MKLIYAKDYEILANTKHYPLAGYWYSMVHLNKYHNGTYSNFYNNDFPSDCPFRSRLDWLTRSCADDDPKNINPGLLYNEGSSYIPEISLMHKAKVLIQNDECKLSITLPADLVAKASEGINIYLIFALDLLKYPDGDVTTGTYTDQMKYIMDVNNISAILAPPPSLAVDKSLISRATNIFDMQFRPECSFRNSLQSRTNQDEVTHYVHGEVDRDTLFEAWKDATKFIESKSGYERARAVLGSDKPMDMLGHMEIGTNGVIHL